MAPTEEMLQAYFDENFAGQQETMYWAGIAAYTHLSSPASEEWRTKHGFNEKGVEIKICRIVSKWFCRKKRKPDRSSSVIFERLYTDTL